MTKRKLIKIDLQKRKEQWQKIIILTDFIKKEVASRLAQLVPPSPKILELRKQAVEFFKNEIFVSVCGQCKGSCCSSKIPPILFSEIIYLCIVNKDFSFPEPDWRFLKSQYIVRYDRDWGSRDKGERVAYIASSCCILLSPCGCLLRDNRPKTCLRHRCVKMPLRSLNVEFLDELSEEYYAWVTKVEPSQSQAVKNIFGRSLYLEEIDTPETFKIQFRAMIKDLE